MFLARRAPPRDPPGLVRSSPPRDSRAVGARSLAPRPSPAGPIPGGPYAAGRLGDELWVGSWAANGVKMQQPSNQCDHNATFSNKGLLSRASYDRPAHHHLQGAVCVLQGDQKAYVVANRSGAVNESLSKEQ